MTELKEEDLPEEITSRQQFAKQFIEEYGIDTKKFRGKTHLICWKVNIGGLSGEESDQYIERIKGVMEPQMKKVAWADFYIATRDEPTQMVIVDLRTMKYVRI